MESVFVAIGFLVALEMIAISLVLFLGIEYQLPPIRNSILFDFVYVIQLLIVSSILVGLRRISKRFVQNGWQA